MNAKRLAVRSDVKGYMIKVATLLWVVVLLYAHDVRPVLLASLVYFLLLTLPESEDK